MADSSHIGFVTCAALREGADDNRFAAESLRGRGHDVVNVVWDDDNVDWRSFDAVVLRSCWDYHLHPAKFRDWLEHLEGLGCTVWNPAGLVRWNHDKLYLASLQKQGVPVVPTVFLDRGGDAGVEDLADRLDSDELVIKPRIGLTAHGAWRASRRTAEADTPRFRHALATGDLMVQPLVEEVIREGEWSLVYLGGRFSHAVLKQAQDGDFRVQHEWGGTETPGDAPAHLVALADQALSTLRESWLYARVDTVDTAVGAVLMELELIEPDLFLRYKADAADRFTAALEERL